VLRKGFILQTKVPHVTIREKEREKERKKEEEKKGFYIPQNP
jgi:hypothetical protein